MPATSLTEFILANIEPILEEWELFAANIFLTHQLDATEARDHAGGILIAMATDIGRAQTPEAQAEKSKGRAPATEELPSEAAQHGAARFLSGFSVTEQVSEFRFLRASVLRLWREATPELPPGAMQDVIRFNEAIDQALAESVARYSAENEQRVSVLDMLLSASPDLSYVLGLDGTIIYANKAWGDLYGTAIGKMIGKKLSSLGSLDPVELKQHVAQVIESKAIFCGEVACTACVKKHLKFEHMLVPILDAQGQVQAVAGTARNMTERHRFEDALKREKEIADTIIESAPGPFFMIDEQFRLVRWNTALNNQTGLSDDQLKGSSMLATFHEDDRALAAAKFLAAFATGCTHMEVRVYTHDHGQRHFIKTARRFVIDSVPYLAGFCNDVTNRRLSEDALEREKQFSDALIESAPGAFYVIDVEGNFVRWNNYLSQLTGLDNAELLNRPLLLSIHEEDRPRAAAIMKVALENGYAQAELRVLTPEHGFRPFSMTVRRFEVGKSSYLLGVGTDTTEWLAKIKNLEHEAWTDPLTHVASRSHFLEMAQLEFERCRRYGHAVSLWMLDVDHFKNVNDTFGHAGGDIALQSLAQTSRQTLRDWDILGRMGGEEFAVLLPETQSDQALLVAERLRSAVAATHVALDDEKSVDLTVSIGIATARPDDVDVDALIKRADEALFEAKRSGRDKVCLAVLMTSDSDGSRSCRFNTVPAQSAVVLSA